MGLWGLPDTIVEALAFHHRPSSCKAKSFTPLTAVHAANALSHGDLSLNTADSPSHIDIAYLSKLGLDGRISEWVDIVKKSAQKESES